MNSITPEHIDSIMEGAEVHVHTTWDKCTVVSIRLKNGFVLCESSACVDPVNYDEELGTQICLDRIKNKLWELEGYRLQCEIGGAQ